MPQQHRDFLPIALGVGALVGLYDIGNDQVIATLSPEHFTVYHPHYFPFENPHAQALCFALAAAAGPGLAWGIMLYWAGNYGPGPVVRAKITLLGAAAVVLITGLAAWTAGWLETVHGKPFYPMFFFPSEDDKLYLSQTVQMTNYLVGALGAAAWLLGIYGWRRIAAKSPLPS